MIRLVRVEKAERTAWGNLNRCVLTDGKGNEWNASYSDNELEALKLRQEIADLITDVEAMPSNAVALVLEKVAELEGLAWERGIQQAQEE